MDWRPTASTAAINLRAEVLQNIRAFFLQLSVLEVDTPVLSRAATTDPFIESFTTRYQPLTRKTEQLHYYLHTSPEFPMKRLLAAGLGSIYQLAKVFRQGESGRTHNPEFTLLEWYRVGYDHHQLMQEIDSLLTQLLKPYRDLSATQFISYQQAFERVFNTNPHIITKPSLVSCCREYGLDKVLDKDDGKDRFFDLLFSHIIQPQLGRESAANDSKPNITFLYDYPASQASLARIRSRDSFQVAERFEIFIEGIELGNGFHELNDSKEQRRRFKEENQARELAQKTLLPLDERLLAALDQLPDCSGVAIGIERLLMVMLGSKDIRDVICFPLDTA